MNTLYYSIIMFHTPHVRSHTPHAKVISLLMSRFIFLVTYHTPDVTFDNLDVTFHHRQHTLFVGFILIIVMLHIPMMSRLR